MDETQSLWTSKDIVTAVIATGLISTVASLFLSFAIDSMKAWLYRKNEAKYIALQTALAFEAFSIRCWSLLEREEEHHRLTGDAHSTTFPEGPKLLTDRDWKTVDVDLCEQVFAFANTIDIAAHEAAYARHHEGDPFHLQTVVRERGKGAWEIAESLRNEYRLPSQTGQRKKLESLFNIAK